MISITVAELKNRFTSPLQLNVAMTHTEFLETGYEALGVSNTGTSHNCATQ